MKKKKRHRLDKSAVLFLCAILALATQWLLFILTHPHAPGTPPPLPWVPLLPGVAIFAAAYLLSWSAEVAQYDIPPALALAVLALVAVLPEYAVDVYFAWTAGQDASYIPYATANMTGSNRLLIGFGWPVIVFVYWLKTKHRYVRLEKRLALETSVLLIATLYAFVIPLKRTLSLMDALVFIGLFLWYFSRVLRGKVEEPEIEGGPAGMIASWPPLTRRFTAGALFLLAAVVIYLAAEPFAEGLLAAGKQWGVDEFILVQWLAPLASEAPEFIVAILFAWRAMGTASFNTLLSSKVNQWTLLVGMLPLAFALSARAFAPMHLDDRQTEEIFLTAAQSLFAVVVLSDFEFSLKDSFWLFILFFGQACYPLIEESVGIDSVHMRYGFAWVYVALAVVLMVFSRRKRDNLGGLFRCFLNCKRAKKS